VILIRVNQNWSEETYNNKPFELPLSWVEPEMVCCLPHQRDLLSCVTFVRRWMAPPVKCLRRDL
jgi:hypothetical protein